MNIQQYCLMVDDEMKKAIVILSLILFLPVCATFASPAWYPLPQEKFQFGKMGKKYEEAQILLFAFDYGHALVYEKLLLRKGKPLENPRELEKEILNEILKILEKRSTTTKLDEEDIAPNYVAQFSFAVSLFDLSHLLHQFVFDVLASSQDRGQKMIDRVNHIYADYRKYKSVILADKCKSMLFMDGHKFSKAFRKKFPSFNLLIWTYHWFQIRLYEDLMKPTKEERDKGVATTVDLFWEYISDLPDSAPFEMMPSMFEDAPTFSKKFPRIAASFDVNHMLHDIVSDILVSERVSLNEVMDVGSEMAAKAQDPKEFALDKCPLEEAVQ